MDINQFASQFAVNLDDSKLVKIGKHYYYADKSLSEIRSKITRDVFSLGIYLGEQDKHFNPSPGFIDILAKLASKRKVFVNKKAEGLFLYGRNILLDSISKNPENIREGIVLVQNEKDENLGYGLFQTQGKDIVVKNLLDKGWYLRKEQRKRK